MVWCCPAEWPAAVEGEGCLNDRVLVEKKAEDDKLRELVAARGWVPHIAAVPARLGVPVTVWAAPESGAGEGDPYLLPPLLASGRRPCSRVCKSVTTTAGSGVGAWEGVLYGGV